MQILKISVAVLAIVGLAFMIVSAQYNEGGPRIAQFLRQMSSEGYGDCIKRVLCEGRSFESGHAFNRLHRDIFEHRGNPLVGGYQDLLNSVNREFRNPECKRLYICDDERDMYSRIRKYGN